MRSGWRWRRSRSTPRTREEARSFRARGTAHRGDAGVRPRGADRAQGGRALGGRWSSPSPTSSSAACDRKPAELRRGPGVRAARRTTRRERGDRPRARGWPRWTRRSSSCASASKSLDRQPERAAPGVPGAHRRDRAEGSISSTPSCFTWPAASARGLIEAGGSHAVRGAERLAGSTASRSGAPRGAQGGGASIAVGAPARTSCGARGSARTRPRGARLRAARRSPPLAVRRAPARSPRSRAYSATLP